MARPDPAALAATVLAQLDEPGIGELWVGTARVPVTNLERPLWPAAPRRKAVTKRDVLRYYAAVSPWLLPHLWDRPVFVSRIPQGITGETFFQKHWEQRPGFTRTVPIYSSHNHRGADYLFPVRRNLTYDIAREGPRQVGEHFARRAPKRVTMAWATRERRGMVFFDANQNSRGKSLAAALSPRRDPRATVAMPLT